MICFENELSDMLALKFWSDRASIVTAFVAMFALILAFFQLKATKKEARKALAYSLYQNYLSLCFNNEIMSYGNENIIKNDIKIYSKYPWFIAQMLFSFEQILKIENNKYWKTAIESQLNKHRWYLIKSKSVHRDEWNKELRFILNNITKE